MRGENWSTQGKTSQSRVDNQQTQSTYDADCRNQTWATLVEGKCSHHQANPASLALCTKRKTSLPLNCQALIELCFSVH